MTGCLQVGRPLEHDDRDAARDDQLVDHPHRTRHLPQDPSRPADAGEHELPTQDHGMPAGRLCERSLARTRRSELICTLPTRTPRRGWSVYGAERSQPVATGCKWDRRESGSNRREPLPWVATSCARTLMVRRGSRVRVRQRACKSPGNRAFTLRSTARCAASGGYGARYGAFRSREAACRSPEATWAGARRSKRGAGNRRRPSSAYFTCS